jgi:hypothetical protein
MTSPLHDYDYDDIAAIPHPGPALPVVTSAMGINTPGAPQRSGELEAFARGT